MALFTVYVPPPDCPVAVTGLSDGPPDSPAEAPDSPVDTGGQPSMDSGGSGCPEKKFTGIPNLGWVWVSPDSADDVDGEAVVAACQKMEKPGLPVSRQRWPSL